MELIALLLLLPLISFSNGDAVSEAAPGMTAATAQSSLDQRPVVAFSEGQWKISPPEDRSLTMTVVESRPALVRGPASASAGLRRIDVIVSAP